MTVFEELKARGLIAQTTNEEEIKELIDSGKAVFYSGFDPTGESLHIGHMMQLIVARHLQRAGNKAIILCGGGTAMVPDPTGKTDIRPILSKEDIAKNIAGFRSQMEQVLSFDEGGAAIVNNADWLLDLNYIDFLRDVGIHFSVNRMLTAECYRTRMEHGLSFIEFNYMLMQAYDFYYLSEKYGVNMQCGGDDQWSNILAGADLIRRKTGKPAHGITFTLLLTSDGKKMGKTMGGAVWIDKNQTSPYEFFQYWRNVGDDDVINTMKMCTFVPLEEIVEFEKFEGAALNPVKERLAFEVTKIIHGEAAATEALNAARAVFSSGAAADMPSSQLAADDFTDDIIGVLDLLVKTGLTASKGEARRLVEQGGISLNDEKVSDVTTTFEKGIFEGDGAVIRKGKKIFHKATV